MAELTPWEKKARELAEVLAKQADQALSYAMMVHTSASEEEREKLGPLRLDEPKFWRNLVPAARKHIEVASAVGRAIRADEDGDENGLRDAMKDLGAFVEGMTVRLSWKPDAGEYRLFQEFTSDLEEYPFITAGLALSFAEYWERYRDTVHLGVCRQCSSVYVKPKHGRKTRYCSGACRQKAYRARQKE